MGKSKILKLILVIMMILTASGVTIAWLSTSLSNSISATASVHKAYFLGEGTEDEPYLIESPVQLYYFAWLQDLGYFNDDYNNGVSVPAPVYFKVENDLDMTGFTLPPAGTAEKPFIGYFDGNGKTISNLNVMSSATPSNLTDVPNNPRNNNNLAASNYQIVGLFGVIGEIGTTYSASSFVPTVTNLNIATTTVYSETPDQNKTLVGIVAGYVNGKVEKVTVADSTVKVKSTGLSALSYTDNLSDYTIVGYCTEPYRKTIDITKVSLSSPTETQNFVYKNTASEGEGFGGSIKMDDLFNRVYSAQKSGSSPSGTYVSGEVVLRDVNGTEISRTTTETSNVSTSTIYYNSSAEGGGKYYYGSSNDYYMYLSQTSKTVVNLQYMPEDKDAVIICDASGNNYLNINSSYNGVTTGNSRDTATKWILKDNKLYTFSLLNGDKCYLNATTSFSIGSTGSTNWYVDNEDILYFNYSIGNISTWYLTYDTTWGFYPAKESYYITDGTNYLVRNGTSSVTTTTNVNSASEWIIDNNRICTLYNNNLYYLNGTTSLSLSTTPSTTWNYENNKYSYNYTDGNTWYLMHDGSNWFVFPSESYYHIGTDSKWIGCSNGTLSALSTDASSKWLITNDNKIYTIDNGTIRYLYGKTDGTKALSTTTNASEATVWTYSLANSGGTMSYSGNWYLYNIGDSWNVYPASSVSVIHQGDNYLVINSTSTVTGGGANDASAWIFENGKISTVYSNGTYYLNSNGATVSVSTTSTTTWSLTNGTLVNNSGWYLAYDGGWVAYPSLEYYTIHSEDNYLSYSNNTTITNTSNPANPTKWFKDGNKYFCIVNGTPRYLRATTSALSLDTQANGTSFTYDSTNKHLSFTSNGTYYVVYDSGWKVSNSLYYLISDGNGNYLTYKGSLSNATSATDASYWAFSNGNSGYISTTYNNNTYYLRYNNGLTTTTNNNNRTSWTSNEGGLHYNNNYITYSGGNWVAASTSQTVYTIRYNNNAYLNVVSTSAVGTGNSVGDFNNGNNTYWFSLNDLTDYGGSTPNGYFFTYINDTKYYLTRSGTSVILTTTATTKWYNYQNGNLYDRVTSGNRTTYYNLNYANNTWGIVTGNTYQTHTITSGTITNIPTLTIIGRETSISDSSLNVVTAIDTVQASTMFFTSASLSTTINRIKVKSVLSIIPTTAKEIKRLEDTKEGSNYYTAFPINAETSAPFAPNDTNTGYVVSGDFSGSNNSADIRISRYNTIDINASTTFYIVQGGNRYLRNNNGTLDSTTNKSQATEWKFEIYYTSNNYYYYISSTSGNNTYYLRYSNRSYSLSTTRNYVSVGRNGYISSSNYYLIYNNGISASTSSNASNVFIAKAKDDTDIDVITATHYTNKNGTTYEGFYRVSDSYNDNSSISSVNLSKVAYDALGLNRYGDARSALNEMVSNQVNLYGLHFMNAEIDKNHTVILPQAKINGEVKTNYKVLNDSINFNVKRRGFITVFAGTYFNGNNAFFALYEIFRYVETDQEVINGTASVDDIKEVKEISKIYNPREGSNEYVYQYKGDNSFDNSGLTLAFDLEWMTNPSTFVNDAVYYFEIPVNGGEFALGSVSGKTGAYLFYLDIAANGGQTEDRYRTSVTEIIKTQDMSAVIPAGVQLVEVGNSYDENSPYELVTLELSTTFKDEYELVRNGNIVTNQNKAGSTVKYVGGNLKFGDENTTTYPNGYTVRKVETIIDKTLTSNNYDKTMIETIYTYDSSETLTSKVTTIYAIESMVDDLADAGDYYVVVSFEYEITESGVSEDDFAIRCVRAASEVGFNIAFNANVTLRNTAVGEKFYVNMYSGKNDTMLRVTQVVSAATNYSKVDMTVPSTPGASVEDVYFAPKYGSDFVSIFYTTENLEDEDTPVLTTEYVFNPELNDVQTSTSISQTLVYNITVTSDNDTLDVHGDEPSGVAAYSTYIVAMSGDTPTISSGTITYSTVTVNLNGTEISSSD